MHNVQKATSNDRLGLVERPNRIAFKLGKAKTLMEAAKGGKEGDSNLSKHICKNTGAEIYCRKTECVESQLFGASRGEFEVAAVRLALSEAIIQKETRPCFLEYGSHLDAAVRLANESQA